MILFCFLNLSMSVMAIIEHFWTLFRCQKSNIQSATKIIAHETSHMRLEILSCNRRLFNLFIEWQHFNPLTKKNPPHYFFPFLIHAFPMEKKSLLPICSNKGFQNKRGQHLLHFCRISRYVVKEASYCRIF